MADVIKLLTGAEVVNSPTGYGVVAKNLIMRLLKKDYEIYHVGWQFFGQSMVLNLNGNSFLSLQHGSVDMGHGGKFPEYWERYLKLYKPDLSFSLIDIWETGEMIRAANSQGILHVNYFPVDGGNFYEPFLQKMKYSSCPLAMSKFGRDVVMDAVKKNGSGGWSHHFNMDFIYHGVDHKLFNRLSKDTVMEQRRKIFEGTPEKEKRFPGGADDTMFFLFVGRNSKRKMIDRLIHAFSIVAKKYRNFHMGMKVGDPMNIHGYGYDIMDLIRYYDMQGRISILDTESNYMEGVDERMLALWNNIADVGISATGGEGFGLTTLESQSCSTPYIITDYTTSRELIGNNERGWLVPYDTLFHGDYNILKALVNIQAMADTMEESYLNEKARRRKGNNAYNWVRKNMTWDIIADKFDKYFRNALDEYSSVSEKDLKKMIDGDVLIDKGGEQNG